MIIEKPKKRDLRQLMGRVIESKEREVKLLREMQSEVESEWSNEQFSGFMTILNYWSYLQVDATPLDMTVMEDRLDSDVDVD